MTILSIFGYIFKIKNFFKSIRIPSNSLKWLILLVYPLVIVPIVTSCAVNPATGSANLVLMSENREKEIGLEEHEKVLSSMTLFEDEALLNYVREVGNKVAQVSHRPDLEYHFHVIDSPEINAFALPGGYVYINRGLLTYLKSEAELAAVLAHEIGHYKHNHIVKSLILSTAVIFVGMFFLSYLINNATYLDLLNLPMNEASQLIALVFTYQIVSFFIEPFFSILSRSNEYEADNFASKQVDKKHLVTSLIKLYKSNLSFLIPNKLYAMFYFSHPTILERIDNLRRSDD